MHRIVNVIPNRYQRCSLVGKFNHYTINDGDYRTYIYRGTSEEVLRYTEVNISIFADVASSAGGLSLEFSTNGTNWDKRYMYNVSASQGKVFALPTLAQYFRVVYTSGSDQSTFRLETTYHNTKNSNQFGEIINGGASHVVVEQSKTSFGEQLVSQSLPIAELDFIYGINDDFVETLVNDGATISVTAPPLVDLVTGTDAAAFGLMRSKYLANYRPGQGIDIRFTAIFTTGQASSSQAVGVGNQDNGFFFGYDGVTFGVLRRTAGVRETRSFTITTGAAANGNITITLNGNAAVVAVTNSTIT